MSCQVVHLSYLFCQLAYPECYILITIAFRPGFLAKKIQKQTQSLLLASYSDSSGQYIGATNFSSQLHTNDIVLNLASNVNTLTLLFNCNPKQDQSHQGHGLLVLCRILRPYVMEGVKERTQTGEIERSRVLGLNMAL